jgi:heme-degrading monooxygenase HmoA
LAAPVEASAIHSPTEATDDRHGFPFPEISREDILAHAYAQCRSNKGAPGVDGQDFADIDNPGTQDEYGPVARRMSELARDIPGYIFHKGFVADDGERVTIVEFETEEAQRDVHPEHAAAKRRGKSASSPSTNSGFAA